MALALRRALLLLGLVLLASMLYIAVFMLMHSGPLHGGLRHQDATRSRFGLGGGFDGSDVVAEGVFGSKAEAARPLKAYPGFTRLHHLPSLESLAFHEEEEDDSITFASAALDIGRKGHRTVNGGDTKNYRFEDDYIERLNYILSWGEPTEVIVQEKYQPSLKMSQPTQQQSRTVELEDLERDFTPFEQIQEIRVDKSWLRQASWLPSSPQAYSPWYNAIVMSKLYWLADLCDRNPFHTRYFVWVDAGICTRTMLGPRNLDRLKQRMRAYMRSDRLWICHAPYRGSREVHGFARRPLHEYAGQRKVNVVPKGGMFGGTCDAIKRALVVYDDILTRTLADGYMGTEETVFSIAHYTHPHLFEPCANERPEQPWVEQMCLFFDDNYPGFGHDHQLEYRASPLYRSGRDA